MTLWRLEFALSLVEGFAIQIEDDRCDPALIEKAARRRPKFIDGGEYYFRFRCGEIPCACRTAFIAEDPG